MDSSSSVPYNTPKGPSQRGPRTQKPTNNKVNKGKRKGTKHEDTTNKASTGEQKKKTKKKAPSKNVQRQFIAAVLRGEDVDTSKLQKTKVILERSEEYPYIVAEMLRDATLFARDIRESDTQCVFYTDGSVTPGQDSQPEPSSLSSSCSSLLSEASSPSPRLSPSRGSTSPSSPDCPSPSSASSTPLLVSCRQFGGASVVYRGALPEAQWICLGFALPSTCKSGEAELHGVDQALQLATDRATHDNSFKKKIVILTDCTEALQQVANCLRKYEPASKTAKAACNKIRLLRQKGIEIELRWVPAHMGQNGCQGNHLANQVARNASNDCSRSCAVDVEEVKPLGDLVSQANELRAS
ncbi:hypothetical protein BJX99DRAFT_225738 [Aspergillus californicus]